MKPEQIFIGDIRKCSYRKNFFMTFTDEIYKKDATLIMVQKDKYVDLEQFQDIVNFLCIQQDLHKNKLDANRLILTTSPHDVGSLYVDKDSLKPYYKEQQPEKVTVYQLKKK